MTQNLDINCIKLFANSEEKCSYLSDKLSTNYFVDPDFKMNSNAYLKLSELGFRRSGNLVYRPHCKYCRQCIATRIEVKNFQQRRRFNRILKKNIDLTVSRVGSIKTDEHFNLFETYISSRHANGSMYPATPELYNSFLQCNWLTSQYFEWRLSKKLISVAVTDELDNALSAIYTFFSPDYANRSLGTLAVLTQVKQAIVQQKKYLYLGYWVEHSKTMHYKSQFRPLQGFIEDNWMLLSDNTD